MGLNNWNLNGEGMVVHALPQEGVCVSDMNFDEIISIRRIVDVE